ncbi:MAG: hypothetical protein JNL98_36765 [Bryobacterales bacterium]|nr:hypothetical protein [Bryobacterales bacterium]
MLLRAPLSVERMKADVAGEFGRTVDLRGPANRANVVFFELPEVVFRHCVGEPEHHVRVGFAVDVRDAVFVAQDLGPMGSDERGRENQGKEASE